MNDVDIAQANMEEEARLQGRCSHLESDGTSALIHREELKNGYGFTQFPAHDECMLCGACVV